MTIHSRGAWIYEGDNIKDFRAFWSGRFDRLVLMNSIESSKRLLEVFLGVCKE